MLWFCLSLAAAIFLATSDALSKIALKDCGDEIVAWAKWGGAAFFLLFLLPFIEIPSLDATFWMVTALAIPLEVTAILFYVRAIKISPLSLTIPFLALTPLFLLVTSFIILGERPSSRGVAGILLIVIGAYTLNLDKSRQGLLAPFKAVRREKGSLLMIAVAFIYSITSSLGKIAVLHSSPLFFAVLYTALLAAALFPFVAGKKSSSLEAVKKRPYLLISSGIFYCLMIVAHFAAIRLVEVSYMVSVKRTSLLLSVLYGWILFREVNIKERFLGSVLMLAGLFLITVS